MATVVVAPSSTPRTAAEGPRDAGRGHSRYQCACCGNWTLVDAAFSPGRLLAPCPVCYWTSDFYQEHDPGFAAPPNHVSLRVAAENYSRIGAIHSGVRHLVRPPRPEESTEVPAH
jgi:hypothetical protein